MNVSGIPLEHTITDALLFILMYALIISLVLILFTIQRKLDRYRIKYTFDRELESKDMTGEDKTLRLDRAERRFKRRVFRD